MKKIPNFPKISSSALRQTYLHYATFCNFHLKYRYPTDPVGGIKCNEIDYTKSHPSVLSFMHKKHPKGCVIIVYQCSSEIDVEIMCWTGLNT